MQTRTELDSAYEIAEKAQAAQQAVSMLEGHPFLILPEGVSAESLAHLLPRPLAIKAAPKFRDPGGFLDYVKRFQVLDTMLFQDPDNARIDAILDYHGDKPSHCQHTARLTVEKSKEWEAWTGANKRSFSQEQFAEFLEEHAEDIAEPDGATIVEVAKHLEATRTVAFKSATSLENGSVSFLYEANVEARTRAQLEIPTRFTLGLRPFRFDDPTAKPFRIDARLRYRLVEDKLTFIFVLDHPERIIEKAFAEIVGVVQAGTGLPVLLGAAG